MTPADIELLRRAARAAGIRGEVFNSPNPLHCGVHLGGGRYWNPLQDKAQTVDLMLAVGIMAGADYDAAAAVHRDADQKVFVVRVEDAGGSKEAAFCRAVTLAAAARMSTITNDQLEQPR